ncbi:sulfite exporter TauE/SafE family protein [Pseudoxanthomonas sp. CAU 1598]|uniref:Probable membrane transporter protein n=1 Tax=Pseudomarimonas arenosa TaxID=2774145 RepID=A0AAW3ZME8_9GAMM|nr:sulfite exporter TauE/SafE family protein [Pseudomarimonas arenosa]
MGEEFWLFVLVGLAAQLVDGALGMAYGVTCTGLLLAMGAPPALASAAVHSAEVGTTAVSGLSHAALGNVSKRLFLNLLLPGVLGAAIGALVIGNIDGHALKPWVAGYLALVGSVVLYRTFRPRPVTPLSADSLSNSRVAPQGLIAGFLDAVGGGGWGSINVTTLLARGVPPRFAIGSVNAAEFFVSLTVASLLWPVVGTQVLPIVGGLLLGGVLAAPVAAWAARKVPPRLASGLSASLVLALSVTTLGTLLI